MKPHYIPRRELAENASPQLLGHRHCAGTSRPENFPHERDTRDPPIVAVQGARFRFRAVFVAWTNHRSPHMLTPGIEFPAHLFSGLLSHLKICCGERGIRILDGQYGACTLRTPSLRIVRWNHQRRNRLLSDSNVSRPNMAGDVIRRDFHPYGRTFVCGTKIFGQETIVQNRVLIASGGVHVQSVLITICRVIIGRVLAGYQLNPS
jgi:hypothetical protein